MRRSALLVPAVVFVLAGTLGSSSPISAQESSEDVTGAGSLRSEEDIDRTDPAEIRRSVERGDFEEALALVRKRIASYPEADDVARSRLLEARILVRLGEVQDAGKVYRRLFEDPEVGDTARTEAHDLLVRRGLFGSADRMTAEAADSSGVPVEDPAELRRYAYSRGSQGHFREVADRLEELAASGDGRAGVLRGNALLALGRREEAETLYLSVLADEEEDAVRQVAHFGLGQVARLRGARAVRAIQNEKAVQLGPAPWAELDWGQTLRALGRHEDARRRLESARRSDPRLASCVRLALARLDEEQGRTDEAVEHLVEGLDGRLSDFLVWTRLGDLLLKKGDDEAGLSAYRRALEIFPPFPPARDRLTRALAARGRWEEAPEPAPEEWMLPGWTWDRLLDGDLPFYELADDIESVSAEDPRRFVLALVQLRSGFPAGALAWTGEESEAAWSRAVRAEALEQVGRTEEAVATWETLLHRDSASGLALERLSHLLREPDPIRSSQLRGELYRSHPNAIRARLRWARFLEEEEDWSAALADYESAAGFEGWLSPEERRRVRVAVEDLEDLIQSEEDELAAE